MGIKGEDYCKDKFPVAGVPFPWMRVLAQVGVCCEGGQ